MAQVQMRKINKAFGKVQVIQDVDLDIDAGDFCVFVGPSGCGKSTLLRLVAGLEEISSGDLYIAGERVNDRAPARRGVAMVFQSYALYPHMTVYQNMAFGLRLAKTDRRSVDARVREAAQILQIDSLLGRLPKQLSGGQRQRVAIGRAIVRHPQVFLFDEPLSNLDAALRVQTRMEIARLHERLGATTIYVTHDQVEAMTLATRIVVLRQGRVEQVGPPLEVYHHPCNTFVAGFIGSPQMSLLPARLARIGSEGATVRLAGGTEVRAAVDASGREGDPVTLGIRPEHPLLGPADGGTLDARVAYSEHLGDHSLVYLALPGAAELLTVRVPAQTRAAAGDVLKVGLPASACHLFNAAGRAYRRLVSSGGVDLLEPCPAEPRKREIFEPAIVSDPPNPGSDTR
jgi:multiple sugar transport system ATP-binding protein